MKTEDLKPGYECVFTVRDYCDGPLKGIANYLGHPHFYERIFDEVKDNYSDLFRLSPLDAEIFQLAMEAWNIWRRWEIAFHTGKTNIGTHPALPHEAKRRAELTSVLDRFLAIDPGKAVARIGQFEVLGRPNLPKGVRRPMQVKWSEPLSESLSTADVR
jgi:hypothetical protein